MCGIAGKLFFDPERFPNHELIEKMCSTLIHRGPDDSGYFVDRNFGFGMRRLSIIDLESGHQPIFNEDGSLAIIFNGEIYNYKYLKSNLESKGHIFKTNSDTETILHCYEEYGIDFVHKLNGMFAIAIWDSRERKLTLVRDRLGIKPLYYYLDNEKFLFGSEIKAIIEDRSIPRELNISALNQYLSYTFVPAPFSIFKNIHKLKPGHLLVVKNGDVNVKRYWELNPSEDEVKSEADFIEEFDDFFNDSVKLRMISDVPLGVFLSGGIDSSAIVAAMSQNSTQTVKTFSIGFKNDARHDETCFAKMISEMYGTEHQVFYVDYDVVNLLPKYIHQFDEPFADYAAFPTYVVAKMAQEHVKVVLTGDGGDEVLAGYKRHYAERVAQVYKRVPRLIRNSFMDSIFASGRKLLPISNRLYDYVKFAQYKNKLVDLDARERYMRSFFYEKFNDSKRSRLFVDAENAFPGYPIEAFKEHWLGNDDNLLNQLYFDVMTNLPDDMLTKVDRATMAVSLEARVPFLDHRLVKFSFTIPSKYKISLWETKRFLRKAVKGKLPRKIIKRPKHGFSSPIDKWLREDLAELVRDTLSESGLRSTNLFNYQFIETLMRDHFKGKANNGNELFMLMVFQLWHDKYLKNNNGF